MNFKNIIRVAEEETRIPESWYLKTILQNIIDRENNEIHENSSVIKDAISNTKRDILEYIDKKANTSIKTKTIEYYIGKHSYSHSRYNIVRAYKDWDKARTKEKSDDAYVDDKDIQYTYNLDENMKLLAAGILNKISQDKNLINKFFNRHDVFSNYYSLNKRSKDKMIRAIADGDMNVQEAYKKLFAFADKSEKELLESEVKNYTQKASEALKSECIHSIRNNIELLDKYGIMNNLVQANNVVNKNIYLFNYDFSYEETMDLLSEKNLKELSAEQLIGMTAYWDNRTAKVIAEMNKAVYILSHPELYESRTAKDGKVTINVSDETLKNIHLKMNILQKVCFEIFDEAEWLMEDDIDLELDSKEIGKGHKQEKNKEIKETKEAKEVKEADNGAVNISFEVAEICEKYDKEYKNYLDKKLEFSKNDLKEDALEALSFENFIYNLYSTKSSNIQALLISAMNSVGDCIQNYGYMDEKNKKDGFMLLGIDIPGMNMPLRLHTHESSILEVFKSAQGKNKEFPKYKGSKDFYYTRDKKTIPAQLFVPVSKEKAKKIKEEVDRITEKDRYGNTIRHIAYIAGKGKMPEHMVNEMDKEAQIEK